MERLFYKKSTSIMIVALAVVLILLLCMLLVALTQYASISESLEQLNQMIDAKNNYKLTLQEWEEYKNSNAYVVEWAIENGLVDENDINYVPAD